MIKGRHPYAIWRRRQQILTSNASTLPSRYFPVCTEIETEATTYDKYLNVSYYICQEQDGRAYCKITIGEDQKEIYFKDFDDAKLYCNNDYDNRVKVSQLK